MTTHFSSKEGMYSVYSVEELESLYALYEIKPYTKQQSLALMHFVNHGNVNQAAKSVGMDPAKFQKLLNEKRTAVVLEYFTKRNNWKYEISKEAITSMFLESYYLAADSGQRVAATRELARLYDLYDEKKNDRKFKGAGTSISIHNGPNNTLNVTSKQIEKMSTEQLLQLAEKHVEAIPGVTLHSSVPETPKDYDPILDV